MKKSIAYSCDKHIVKMTLEYAQILSTCHHKIDGVSSPIFNDIYRPTHKNHSCIYALLQRGKSIFTNRTVIEIFHIGPI